MSVELRDLLLKQLAISRALCAHHLETLSTEECLWRPAPAGLHVRRDEQGRWQADWPSHEGYDLGPSSIAWLTWHLGFWWSMVLDHSFGDATLTREDVLWPGDADSVRSWLSALESRWVHALEQLTDDDLRSTARTRWPLTEQPFAEIVGWVNIELAKNAAEIGYARFLHAVRPR